MAENDPHDLRAQAVAWRLRLEDGDADWEAFVEWLEGDPARSDAYDKIEAADAAILAADFPAATGPVPVAANDGGTPTTGRRFGMIGGGALVAAALAAIVVVPMVSSKPDRYEVATASGEQRRVEIADGSSAMLNGATRLILDHDDPRFAELVSGEATFTVRHDSGEPFTVLSGEHRVQDSGTTFNVIRDRGDFTVEVIEGAVIYNPDDAAIALKAGKSLRASRGAAPVVVDADPEAMAGWRNGQLNYVGAPLARVAGDLSRTLGAPIAVADELAELPLTGSIRIRSDDAATVRDLALVADVGARRKGNGWIIEPLTRAPR